MVGAEARTAIGSPSPVRREPTPRIPLTGHDLPGPNATVPPAGSSPPPSPIPDGKRAGLGFRTRATGWPQPSGARTNCNWRRLGPENAPGPSRDLHREGPDQCAEARGFEWTVSPNRISSSGRGGSEPSHLGQRVPVISPERHGTAGNCNGNCNWGNALDDARAVDLSFAHAPVARACDTR